MVDIPRLLQKQPIVDKDGKMTREFQQYQVRLRQAIIDTNAKLEKLETKEITQ